MAEPTPFGEPIPVPDYRPRRLALDESLDVVGTRIGIDPALISRIERGLRHHPPVEKKLKAYLRAREREQARERRRAAMAIGV